MRDDKRIEGIEERISDSIPDEVDTSKDEYIKARLRSVLSKMSDIELKALEGYFIANNIEKAKELLGYMRRKYLR